MEKQTIRPLSMILEEAVVIKALIAFRVAAVSFFLGVVIIFQNEFGSLIHPLPISMLIAATYLLSVLYLTVLGRVQNTALFVYLQLAVDLLIETGIIYYTGGGNSPFTFLYLLTIVSSVVAAQPYSGYGLASGASILYGLLVSLESYGVLSPPPLLAANPGNVHPQGYVFFMALVHMSAFYLVAFLSDFLSRRLRQTIHSLSAKSSDLTYLQAFHQNVIANMGSGFMALDNDGVIVSSNNAAEQILESPKSSFMKKRIEAAFPTLVVESGRGVENKSEWSYVAPGGTKKLLSFTSSQFKDADGSALGVIIIFQDITNFKLMEAAVSKSERLAAMGRMAAGLAHEIKNPLGSISGSIQIIKDSMEKGNTAPNEKLMAIILRETARLDSIIGRFLSYAAPNTRKVPDVGLSALLSDSVALFSNDARYAGHVRAELDVDERIRCECDPEALKQVFWNLLLNAAQAMPGGGTIKISLKPVPGEGEASGRCLLTFSDSGAGISNESLGKIFEPFFTTKEGGTGLGLPLALKIIESHEGTLAVRTKEGVGTTFSIRLPITPL
ncbi:MAG: PAS domain-containing protein [Nitrospinae bacterium]|nr:PAS domain-containing protein [Nitrospinota bacterium]